MKIHIGMRKIKSLMALTLTFAVWQIVRIFLPTLSPHPIFAYIYSVVEIRETVDKTKRTSRLRVKATFIGLIVGLIFIFLSYYVTSMIRSEMWSTAAELFFILLATLVALIAAEQFKCETFCGIAAIIPIICMVSHNEEDIYFYAIMRVFQTFIGIFSALLINGLIKRKDPPA